MYGGCSCGKVGLSVVGRKLFISTDFQIYSHCLLLPWEAILVLEAAYPNPVQKVYAEDYYCRVRIICPWAQIHNLTLKREVGV